MTAKPDETSAPPVREVERVAIRALCSPELSVHDACECFMAAMSLRDPTADVRLNITWPRHGIVRPKVAKRRSGR